MQRRTDERAGLLSRWRGLLPEDPARPVEEDASVDPVAARRFTQGRAFYRTGRVTGLRIGPGRLSASVQGARATPYHVEALVELLDAEAWSTVVTTVATEVRFAAGLLAGRVPDVLLNALDARGIDLVGGPDAVDARCPCGEAAAPCAHVVALWEAAAERFTDDPFALLHLRGRGRQRFLADLSAARRVRGAERGTRVSLHELAVERWAGSATDLTDLEVHAGARPDSVAAPLRLLGDPPGWAGAQSAVDALAPLIVAGARRAGRLLRGDPDES